MKKILSLLFAIGLILTGCDDFLEENVHAVATNYLESEEGLESLLTGTYYYITFGPSSERAYIYSDMGTDTFHQGDGGSYSYFDTYESISPDDSRLQNFWDNNYVGIANANNGIENAQALELPEYEAEFRFLRAYFYFELVRQFGAIPLVTESTTTVVTSYSRAAVSEVYAQIIEDLTYAYENLPSSPSVYGRATKWAAAHELALVYLTRGSAVDDERGQTSSDMSNALEYAEIVINSGYHSLIDDFDELWDIDNQGNEEVIFAIQYGTNTLYVNSGNQLHLMHCSTYEDFPGMVRDLENGRPWGRLRVTENYMFGDLYDWANDSRAIKNFRWCFYANSDSDLPTWEKIYSSSDGTTLIFDPADIGMTEGELKFEVGDTAYVLSVEKTGYYTTDDDGNIDYAGTDSLNKIMAQYPYTYYPFEMHGLKYYPMVKKHIDNQRAAVSTTAGTREFVRMRLGETYLIAAEAAARDGDYSTAAKYLNVIRERASWKDGETKNMHVWKYYGGNNDTESTYSALEVSASDLSGLDDDELVDYFLDERAREMVGELNRWEDLVRCEKLYERVTKYNQYATNIREYHKLRPIPQDFIDSLDPTPEDSEIQNEGYY